MLRLRGNVPINYTVAETASYFVYLSACLANFKCSGDYTNCGGSSPKPLCIRQPYVCDKSKDCDNDWDELPETCGEFALSFVVCNTLLYNTRKLSYRKDDRAMGPIYGCPGKFRESWLRPRLLFPKFIMGVCSDRYWECAHNIGSSWLYPFVRYYGVLQKLRQLLDTPMLLFSHIFKGLFSDGPCNYTCQIWSSQLYALLRK